MKKINLLAIIATLILGFTILMPTTEANAMPFTDVKNTNAKNKEMNEAITALYNDEIVFGATATTYKPNQAATRAETAQMIVNAVGWQGEDATNPGFTDVSGQYADAIFILANKGVVNVNAKFNPNKTLTRSQVAKMITLAFGLEVSTDKKTKFKDVKNDEVAMFVNTLLTYEITTGTTATTFSPNKSVTRGQLALFLYRGLPSLEDSSDFEIIGIE